VTQTLHREGFSRKKTEHRHRDCDEVGGLDFVRRLRCYDTWDLIDVDEMSQAPDDFLCPYAWGEVGKPVVTRQIIIGTCTFSIIAAVTPLGFLCWGIIEGMVTQVEFCRFLSNTLGPVLPRSSMIMIDNAKTFIAWESIVDDIKSEKINLDMAQIKQAKKDADTAKQIIEQSVKDSFKHILCPLEEMSKGKQELIWEVTSLSHVSGNLARAVEDKLRQEEWLIFEWAAIHLSRVFGQWYVNESSRDVVTKKLWNDMASYLYLPRLKDEKVLKDAITQGIISEDFFGYAQGKEGDKYLGLVIGRPGDVTIDESSVLIDKRTALDAKAKVDAEHRTPANTGEPAVGGHQHPTTAGPSAPASRPLDPTGARKVTKFFAVKELDVRAPKPDFSKVIDEIVLHLTTNRHNFVSISVEIQAENTEGFDETTQRTLNENCRSINFKEHEFSED
jgi:hypothetical protein